MLWELIKLVVVDSIYLSDFRVMYQSHMSSAKKKCVNIMLTSLSLPVICFMQNYTIFACARVPGSQCICYRALIYHVFPMKDQVSDLHTFG